LQLSHNMAVGYITHHVDKCMDSALVDTLLMVRAQGNPPFVGLIVNDYQY